jgi:hypothetical protein
MSHNAPSRATFARFAIDLPRHNTDCKRQHDPRSLVIEAIRAGGDPDAETLAAALRQPPPNPRAVAKVSLTDTEQAELFDAERWDAEQSDAFRRRISAERWSAAIAQAAQEIQDDQTLLTEYVIRT